MQFAPDSKGKIERRFDTFQKRLVSLLSCEGIHDYPQANQLLQLQIHWHNHQQVCRTTGLTPDQAWDKALQEKRSRLRPPPPLPLLDLPRALHLQRRLNADSTLDFLGQTWAVTPCRSKIVTVVHPPQQCFWVISQPPDPRHPIWPPVLAHYRL